MIRRPSVATARRLSAALLAAGALLLWPASAWAGDTADIQAQPSLSVSFQASTNPRLPDYLLARVESSNQRPVGQEAVHFYLATDFLGAEWIHLGQATTDSTGIARMAVSLAGRSYEVRAQIRDADGKVVAQTIAEITTPMAPSRPDLAPSRPLDGFLFWMPRLLGLGVVAIWLVLIVAAVLAVGGIRRGRRAVEEP